MSDIELVIKMSEEKYKWIKENNPKADKNSIVGAIVYGTPLPKGHGELKDADIIKDFKNKIKHYGKDYRFTQEEILNILERYEIKYTSTIIEADRSVEDGNND